MLLTVCDVAVSTWARSSDLRVVYKDNLFLYGRLLMAFSIIRNQLLLVASSLRYRIVLINSTHQKMLVCSATVLALVAMTAEYVTGFTSLVEKEGTGVSRAFWFYSTISPAAFSIMGLMTFTLQLRRNRITVANGEASDSARQLQNLEAINNMLIFGTVTCGVATILTAFLADPDSYYITPLEVTTCAYWAVGENMFEVLALFKASAETAAASRIPTGVSNFVAFSKVGLPGHAGGSGTFKEGEVLLSAEVP
ncbi:hypothetical protein HDU86_004185 [Geranomyces michiganensis]|nr:hypothetical protein HDU86_004185 [Geranomyces michiganensis]